jgi:serine/threonine protein kinase
MPDPMYDGKNNDNAMSVDSQHYSNDQEIKDKKNYEEMNAIINKKDISSKDGLLRILEKEKPSLLEIYEIKEFIGSGSESVVYKAVHKISKKLIAIKFILLGEEKKRNSTELNILYKLKHKNIIGFYGMHEIKKNELDCLIMEYAKFGNIRDFQKNTLKKKDLSEQILCFFAFQILNGLKYCHKCKVAHLDIKPQNIIIDDYLTLKIIDFSVSLDYSRIKSNKIKLPFRGTNFYMAPEVIQKNTINVKDLNKVDLYSLGVILYHLAFYSYPYDLNSEDANDYDRILRKIQNNTLSFNNEDNCFSTHFIDFVSKLLQKDIDKRMDINEAMNHYWIKGGELLFTEKEKIYNAGCFLIHLITDHIESFDKYINKV